MFAPPRASPRRDDAVRSPRHEETEAEYVAIHSKKPISTHVTSKKADGNKQQRSAVQQKLHEMPPLSARSDRSQNDQQQQHVKVDDAEKEDEAILNVSRLASLLCANKNLNGNFYSRAESALKKKKQDAAANIWGLNIFKSSPQQHHAKPGTAPQESRKDLSGVKQEKTWDAVLQMAVESKPVAISPRGATADDVRSPRRDKVEEKVEYIDPLTSATINRDSISRSGGRKRVSSANGAVKKRPSFPPSHYVPVREDAKVKYEPDTGDASDVGIKRNIPRKPVKGDTPSFRRPVTAPATAALQQQDAEDASPGTNQEIESEGVVISASKGGSTRRSFSVRIGGVIDSSKATAADAASRNQEVDDDTNVDREGNHLVNDDSALQKADDAVISAVKAQIKPVVETGKGILSEQGLRKHSKLLAVAGISSTLHDGSTEAGSWEPKSCTSKAFVPGLSTIEHSPISTARSAGIPSHNITSAEAALHKRQLVDDYSSVQLPRQSVGGEDEAHASQQLEELSAAGYYAELPQSVITIPSVHTSAGNCDNRDEIANNRDSSTTKGSAGPDLRKVCTDHDPRPRTGQLMGSNDLRGRAVSRGVVECNRQNIARDGRVKTPSTAGNNVATLPPVVGDVSGWGWHGMALVSNQAMPCCHSEADKQQHEGELNIAGSVQREIDPQYPNIHFASVGTPPPLPSRDLVDAAKGQTKEDSHRTVHTVNLNAIDYSLPIRKEGILSGRDRSRSPQRPAFTGGTIHWDKDAAQQFENPVLSCHQQQQVKQRHPVGGISTGVLYSIGTALTPSHHPVVTEQKQWQEEAKAVPGGEELENNLVRPSMKSPSPTTAPVIFRPPSFDPTKITDSLELSMDPDALEQQRNGAVLTNHQMSMSLDLQEERVLVPHLQLSEENKDGGPVGGMEAKVERGKASIRPLHEAAGSVASRMISSIRPPRSPPTAHRAVIPAGDDHLRTIPALEGKVEDPVLPFMLVPDGRDRISTAERGAFGKRTMHHIQNQSPEETQRHEDVAIYSDRKFKPQFDRQKFSSMVESFPFLASSTKTVTFQSSAPRALHNSRRDCPGTAPSGTSKLKNKNMSDFACPDGRARSSYIVSGDTNSHRDQLRHDDRPVREASTGINSDHQDQQSWGLAPLALERMKQQLEIYKQTQHIQKYQDEHHDYKQRPFSNEEKMELMARYANEEDSYECDHCKSSGHINVREESLETNQVLHQEEDNVRNHISAVPVQPAAAAYAAYQRENEKLSAEKGSAPSLGARRAAHIVVKPNIIQNANTDSSTVAINTVTNSTPTEDEHTTHCALEKRDTDSDQLVPNMKLSWKSFVGKPTNNLHDAAVDGTNRYQSQVMPTILTEEGRDLRKLMIAEQQRETRERKASLFSIATSGGFTDAATADADELAAPIVVLPEIPALQAMTDSVFASTDEVQSASVHAPTLPPRRVDSVEIACLSLASADVSSVPITADEQLVDPTNPKKQKLTERQTSAFPSSEINQKSDSASPKVTPRINSDSINNRGRGARVTKAKVNNGKVRDRPSSASRAKIPAGPSSAVKRRVRGGPPSAAEAGNEMKYIVEGRGAHEVQPTVSGLSAESVPHIFRNHKSQDQPVQLVEAIRSNRIDNLQKDVVVTKESRSVVRSLREDDSVSSSLMESELSMLQNFDGYSQRVPVTSGIAACDPLNKEWSPRTMTPDAALDIGSMGAYPSNAEVNETCAIQTQLPSFKATVKVQKKTEHAHDLHFSPQDWLLVNNSGRDDNPENYSTKTALDLSVPSVRMNISPRLESPRAAMKSYREELETRKEEQRISRLMQKNTENIKAPHVKPLPPPITPQGSHAAAELQMSSVLTEPIPTGAGGISSTGVKEVVFVGQDHTHDFSSRNDDQNTNDLAMKGDAGDESGRDEEMEKAVSFSSDAAEEWSPIGGSASSKYASSKYASSKYASIGRSASSAAETEGDDEDCEEDSAGSNDEDDGNAPNTVIATSLSGD